MKQTPETMEINGETYVRADTGNLPQAEHLDGMPYCIVRTYTAGVFAGYIKRREGKEVCIRKARRLWYWKGAASLSQLAESGPTMPEECKFPEEVDEIIVTDAIEILSCTEKAKNIIAEVSIWTA